MKRNIKFRIWDIRKKKFIKNLDNFAIDCNGLVLRFYKESKKTEGYVITANYFGGREEYIAQEFTGIKDENGKKIYEGDIVETSYFVGCICYSKISSAFVLNLSKDIHIFDIDNSLLLCDTQGKLNIIGNIFENSELLK